MNLARSIVTGCAVALFAGAVAAQQKGYTAGSTVADFTLNDLEGTKRALKTLAEGKKYVVVSFWSRECEPVRKVEDRLQKLYTDFEPKSVAFVHVVSSKKENKAEDDVKKTKETVKARKIAWTVLLDPDNKVADAFNATVTPTFFVIDAKDLKCVYAGALTDDPWKNANVTKEYVKEALELLLAGKPVATATTKAEGTTIKRV
jgi:thiol-disulfide isomerase/thioredoxin